MITIKQTWWRRSLSLLMAVVMLLSMNVVNAFAEEETPAEQDSSVNWVSLYGKNGNNSIATTCDSINDTIMLVDGNIVSVGAFDGNKVTETVEGMRGKTDAALMLYDAKGSLQFETLVGGSSADYFNSVVNSNNGGYIAVGASQSGDGDLTGLSKGGYDAIIAQFDDDGMLEKIVSIGGSDKDQFNDVFPCYDGGYIAVGYTHSVDGDIAATGKTNGDRDALVVKFSPKLQIEWLQTVGGVGNTTELDEFNAVMQTLDGGYVAVGYSGTANGEFEEIALGGKDALAVKFSEDGTKEWIKVYGGTGDDEFTDIVKNHEAEIDSLDRTEVNLEELDTGYVLVGSSESKDILFADSEADVQKAFILHIDKNGGIKYSDILENSSGATGKSIIAINDGFLMTGNFSANDMDFAGTTAYGKEDVYVAHYSKDGYRLNVFSYGSDDKETVKGIISGYASDYLLFGNTKSSLFYAQETAGKYDGFLMSVKAEKLEYCSDEKMLVPVVAWKANEDGPSMMAPMLYQDAYIEKTGNQYLITVYFKNAEIMGIQSNASSLGDVSYVHNFELIKAERDEYDSSTQVKTVSVKADNLDEPIMIHIEDVMGDIRLKFSPENAVETQTPPYFPPIVIDVPDFDCAWKVNIGGSDYDYSGDITILKNKNILVAGQTYSHDGDFDNKFDGGSGAFINEYTAEGEFVGTIVLSGTQYNSISFANGLAAAEDGGFFVAGGYKEESGVSPTGDFAALKTEDSIHGEIDAFVAKYDADKKLVWMANFSGSQYDQVKSVKATPDGGCVVLLETNSNDGDMDQQNKGLFDLVVVKYSKNGIKEWQQVLGGVNLESSVLGIDLLPDGEYIVGGYLSSKIGDFDMIGYGGLFDLFAAKLDLDGTIKWIRTYGGDKNDYCNGIIATSDGGFLLFGDTLSTTDTFLEKGTSYDNTFLIKCNSDGDVEWTDVIKSTGNSETTDVIELEDRYVVLGQSRGTDYDFKDLNKGSMDVFVAEYDKSGNRTSLETIGGSFADYAGRIIQLNDYQLTVLMEGDSADGDFEGLNKGKFDVTILTYNFAQPDMEDGVYNIDVGMYKPDGVNPSMVDSAINHNALLEIKDGKYYLYLQFKGVTMNNKTGYLQTVESADGETWIPAEVITTQKDSDGNDLIDEYNDKEHLYPLWVKIELPDKLETDSVMMKFLIPVMESIMPGGGTQTALLKLNPSTLKKTDDDALNFKPGVSVEQSPAVDITDPDTNVKVNADKGVFEEGVQIVVTEITSGYDHDNAASVLSDIGNKFKLYDVKFLDKDGNEVLPNGTVTISFPIGADYNSEKLAVYRINDDGSKTLIKGNVENSFYSIITKNSAKYVLVEKNSTISDEQNTANGDNEANQGATDSSQTGVQEPQNGAQTLQTGSPQTGDNLNNILWVMLIFSLAGVVAMMTIAKKANIK